MTRRSFAEQLEQAADDIADLPRHELQVLLRRAALRLRNLPTPAPDPESEYLALIEELNVADALASIAAELREPQSDLVKRILREWLETNAYMPVTGLDGNGEVGGNT